MNGWEKIMNDGDVCSFAETLWAGLTIRILRKRSIKLTGHGSGPAMINARPCKKDGHASSIKFHIKQQLSIHTIQKQKLSVIKVTYQTNPF